LKSREEPLGAILYEFRSKRIPKQGLIQKEKGRGSARVFGRKWRKRKEEREARNRKARLGWPELENAPLPLQGRRDGRNKKKALQQKLKEKKENQYRQKISTHQGRRGIRRRVFRGRK